MTEKKVIPNACKLAEKVADKKQYALDVANIEKYDRGQIERTGPHKDGPLSNQGERYLSFRPTLPPSVILYCYIMEPRELAVMDLTKTDVVVSVREHHDERCSFVVMSKEQFAKHKKTFLAYNTRQVARESEERADEQRLRVAYEAWKVGQRPLHK